MIRWFRAHLEGYYVGVPVASAAPSLGRRARPQIYRASLRDLRFIDPPAAPREPAASAGSLWQAQIDHAQLDGVRGPGTHYEGPIFDVHIAAVALSHATEHRGRSYGRIEGEATGYLELPPLPEAPRVTVHEREAAAAAEPEPPAPLQGFVYTTADSGGELEASGVSLPSAVELRAEQEAQASPVAGEPQPGPGASLDRSVQWLAGFTVLAALALAAYGGTFYAGIWLLFMLPTLLARRLLHGVLRDSGPISGFGYLLIALQVLCTSTLVSKVAATGCAEPTFWAALASVLMLFPTALLPSAKPITCSALGLAVSLAALSTSAHHSGDPACKRAARVRARATETRATSPMTTRTSA